MSEETETTNGVREFASVLANLTVYRGQKDASHLGSGLPSPHKPLLVLLALGSARSEAPRLHPFSYWEASLRPLLDKYAYGKGPHHPEYPFVRLAHDYGGRIWELQPEAPGPSAGDVTAAALRAAGTRGGLSRKLFALAQDPRNAGVLVRAILRTYWDTSSSRYSVAVDTRTAELLFE